MIDTAGRMGGCKTTNKSICGVFRVGLRAANKRIMDSHPIYIAPPPPPIAILDWLAVNNGIDQTLPHNPVDIDPNEVK